VVAVGRVRTPARRSSPDKAQITDTVQSELTKSFASAADTASQYPQNASAIIAGAKSSFLDGADWAYTAGVIAVVAGGVLVFFFFPAKDEEESLLEEYQRTDATAEPHP
jgi:hypothetical protein